MRVQIIRWGIALLFDNAYDVPMSKTSDLIKRLRSSGLTQSEIARRTGIPQPRISRWENSEEPTAADDVLLLVALEEEVVAAGKEAAQA